MTIETVYAIFIGIIALFGLILSIAIAWNPKTKDSDSD